ncbi:DUF4232 domain-containing protein [Pseudonocardia xinjiangensis]|uniref:DUF4232 domain-containing protein n=1 Tax=Pseudonocardia xinjiangensis TaxID=75289 RepID=UPI003D92415E
MWPADGVPPARPPWTGRVVTAAGVLVMVAAVAVAQRYTLFWFDPDEGCALHGRCATPESANMLRAMWWVAGAGFLLVLAGRALTWRRLPLGPRSAARFPLPPWGQAGSVALVGLAFCVVAWPVLLAGAFVPEPGIPTALCIFWLLQARLVTEVDRATGPPRRPARVEWLIGLVDSAVALAVTVGVALWLTDGGPDAAGPLLIADAATLAAVVLLGRVLPARGGQPPVPVPVRNVAGAVIAVLGVAALVALAVPWPDSAGEPVAAGPPAAAVLPTPPPEPARRTTAPAPPPAPVDAANPCLPGDLTWSVAGWDATMGSRAVTVVATQHSPHPCYLDGFAGVTLAQGGRPLRLDIVPGSMSGSGKAPTAQRVGVAPGGTASFTLFWKGYGAAADHDTPQTMSVTLPGTAAPGDVPLGEGPAPFDVVDGATMQVSGWKPGRP